MKLPHATAPLFALDRHFDAVFNFYFKAGKTKNGAPKIHALERVAILFLGLRHDARNTPSCFKSSPETMKPQKAGRMTQTSTCWTEEDRLWEPKFYTPFQPQKWASNKTNSSVTSSCACCGFFRSRLESQSWNSVNPFLIVNMVQQCTDSAFSRCTDSARLRRKTPQLKTSKLAQNCGKTEVLHFQPSLQSFGGLCFRLECNWCCPVEPCAASLPWPDTDSGSWLFTSIPLLVFLRGTTPVQGLIDSNPYACSEDFRCDIAGGILFSVFCENTRAAWQLFFTARTWAKPHRFDSSVTLLLRRVVQSKTQWHSNVLKLLQKSSQASKTFFQLLQIKRLQLKLTNNLQNSYQISSQHQVPKTWVKQHPKTPKTTKTNENPSPSSSMHKLVPFGSKLVPTWFL